MPYMNANEMHSENSWWKLRKDAMSHIEPIREATSPIPPPKQQLNDYVVPISQNIHLLDEEDIPVTAGK